MDVWGKKEEIYLFSCGIYFTVIYYLTTFCYFNKIEALYDNY